MDKILLENKLQLFYVPVPIYGYCHNFGVKERYVLGYATGLAYLVGENKSYFPNGSFVSIFKVVFLKDYKNIDDDYFRTPHYYDNECDNAEDVNCIIEFSLEDDKDVRDGNKLLMDSYCSKMNKNMEYLFITGGHIDKIKKQKDEYYKIIEEFSSKLNACFTKAKVYKR